MKKLLSIALVVVLLAGIAVSGTMAYLMDTDSDVNVMTLGNVYIEQHEYERELNDDGSYKTGDVDNQKSYILQPFTQFKPLLPIVGDPSSPVGYQYAGWDKEATVRMSQVKSYGYMDVFAGKNAQDKFVTVENTGRTGAYVRTIIAFELGGITTDRFAEIVGTSTRSTDDKTNFNQPWLENEVGVVEIDDNNYVVVEFVYHGAKLDNGFRHENGVLPAGDTTYPSLAQVYLGSDATNEDVEKLDGNKNGTYDILVLSQAVQTEGFADAKTALNTAFGEANADNVEAWFEDDETGVNVPVLVTNSEELVKALEAGEDVVLTDDVKIDPANMSNAYGTTGINVTNGQTIDGNGNTLDIRGANGTWDSGINTTGGLIKNITVTGSFRGIFINHNSTYSEPVVLENVTIEGTTYTISCDQGMNQDFEATDSTFKGWTSYAATLGNAKFVDCYFGEGSGYAFCRPFAPTEFIGCEFEAGYVMDPRAAVTFENCTIGDVALTAENLATLVTSNIDNATVK